jgi:hypothetical protein
MSGSDLCIPRNETAQPRYFQNRILMICFPIFTFMYLWAIYNSQDLGLPILLQPNRQTNPGNIEIAHRYIYECRNWEWGRAVSFLEIHKSDFRYSVITNLESDCTVLQEIPVPLGDNVLVIKSWRLLTFSSFVSSMILSWIVSSESGSIANRWRDNYYNIYIRSERPNRLGKRVNLDMWGFQFQCSSLSSISSFWYIFFWKRSIFNDLSICINRTTHLTWLHAFLPCKKTDNVDCLYLLRSVFIFRNNIYTNVGVMEKLSAHAKHICLY